MTINYVLQFLGIVFIICMCLYVIYKILFSIINLIDEKRKREKELKDFINYIKDED